MKVSEKQVARPWLMRPDPLRIHYQEIRCWADVQPVGGKWKVGRAASRNWWVASGIGEAGTCLEAEMSGNCPPERLGPEQGAINSGKKQYS